MLRGHQIGGERVWAKRSYGQCGVMGNADLWVMRRYGLCGVMGNAELWVMRRYEDRKMT